MPVSEKKKASNAKWDKENMTTLGCRVKKEDAIAFKQYCGRQGKTSNTMLKEFVGQCIDAETALQPPEAPQDGKLVLTELGYDPLVKKVLYSEKLTGKQYFVEPVKLESEVEEPDDDALPF